ncbi:MAG: hypothetical protein KDK90_13130 [Leptospiraceae bacterium]|nr:hypothetical protein [Leptospiraceae bacterium]
MKRFLFLTKLLLPILALTSGLLMAETFEKKIFWPMFIRLPISGSFGEFRNRHLHMGCDFKTYGINGFPILSVFDGELASMSYSAWGYGLSIVTYSPTLNLYARYGHLNDLKGDVKGLDELKMAFLLLGNPKGFYYKIPPGMFKFKAKEPIARSGETGSGVSHLHLEIYNQSGYYNPLPLFDYRPYDNNPPVIQRIYIESDRGYLQTIPVIQNEDLSHKIEIEKKIKVGGKLKIKVAGYDLMTSKNKNGIYELQLKVNNGIVFEKKFLFMTTQDAATSYNLYDIHKSSLNPPHYVHNLFNPDGYSLDISQFRENSDVRVGIHLYDVAGNESKIILPLVVSNANPSAKNENLRAFASKDSKISLDFKENLVFGEGTVTIEKLDKLPDEMKVQDFLQISEAYKIEAIDYTWKGAANGAFSGDYPDTKDSLYLYDTTIRNWLLVTSWKTKEAIKFKLGRTGILAVMRDNVKPVIYYPYLIYRDYNLPEIKEPEMIDKFYAVSDVGSGISGNVEVLLEGQPYPFKFDWDRNFVILEIPKSLEKQKDVLLLQIRVTDNAKNYSEWFTDLITF